MKLTEKKIKQIILEELQDIYEIDEENPEEEQKPLEDSGNPEDEEKVASDVAIVLKQMSRIDNHIEYSQLLDKAIAHDFGDPQRKSIILRNLRNKLNKMLSGK